MERKRASRSSFGKADHHARIHLHETPIRVVGKALVPVASASPSTTSSFKPRFRMVSIMPGIDCADPERTLTSSGSRTSPSFFPVSFSSRAIFF